MNGTLLPSALFVLATVVANVLQKKAVTALGPSAGLSWRFAAGLLRSPYMWGGLGAYVVALSMYLLILSRVPLNVATSIAALNFVAVLLASRLLLGEPLPPLRYAGFACILLGIWIVSLTQRGGR